MLRLTISFSLVDSADITLREKRSLWIMLREKKAFAVIHSGMVLRSVDNIVEDSFPYPHLRLKKW